jgi:hypothetical protein
LLDAGMPWWPPSGSSLPATHFLLLAPEQTRVGQQTPVDVVALNAANHVVTNYTGTVHFTSSNTGNALTGDTLPADYTFTAGDHGRHLFFETPQTAGTQTVTATDTTTSSITGSVSLQVNPAAVATHFIVVAPENVQAGQSTPVLVAALDASNHVVPNYTGTIKLTSSDGGATLNGATLPANYTFTTSDHGVHVFDVTFANTGPQTVTATDTANSSVTGTVSVTVNPPAVATHFFVLTPEHAQTGKPTPVLVVALDASNHVVPNYTGTVQLTSSDSGATLNGATLPATYTFQASDHGYHIFDVTFAATGSQTVTATDANNSSITGTATVLVGQAATGVGGGSKGDDPDNSTQALNDGLFTSLPVWWWGARGR